MSLLATAAAPSAVAESAPTRDAIVVHVDDGDTIDVRVDGRIERVRYIGIDAPEIAHDGAGAARGGGAATRLNQALVGGRHVKLEFDRVPRDRYGRVLAYVWVGNVMINREMIRRGYARVLTIPPNVRYERWFANAQAEAQTARRGLWGDGDLDAVITGRGRGGRRSENWRAPHPAKSRRVHDHAVLLSRPVRRHARRTTTLRSWVPAARLHPAREGRSPNLSSRTGHIDRDHDLE